MPSLLAVDHLAIVDLNGPGHYLQWGFLQVSWANAIVILLMVGVFILALLVPFPGTRGATVASGGGLPGEAPPGRDSSADGSSSKPEGSR